HAPRSSNHNTTNPRGSRSGTVSAPVTSAPVGPAQVTVNGAGQVIVDGGLEMTVTVVVQVGTHPLVSDTLTSTWCGPGVNRLVSETTVLFSEVPAGTMSILSRTNPSTVHHTTKRSPFTSPTVTGTTPTPP